MKPGICRTNAFSVFLTLICVMAAPAVSGQNFRVDPHHNTLWGHEWPVGAALAVTIGDPAWEGSTHANEWGDFHLDVWDFDIQAGDRVTVTDGVTTKEHIVTSLTISYTPPPLPETPVITYPAHGQSDVELNPTFTWESVADLSI